MEITPELINEIFEARGQNPHPWRGLALGLKKAADLLYASEVEPLTADLKFWYGSTVYTGLAGLALEVAAKGVRAATDPTFIDPAGTKAGHNVREQIRRAGLYLNDTEGNLCDRLTVSVEWHGRYPIPTTAAKLSGGGRCWTFPADVLAINALFTRVLERLDQCCKPITEE